MGERHRVIIIGGDAGGMAAASQIKKGRPDAEIIAFEQGSWTSYSACGIPFVVGGEVAGGVQRLVSRSPEQHRANGIDLRMHHRVIAIDTAVRMVEVRDLDAGRTFTEGFDQLLIGTGGSPVRPPLPGIDLPCVHSAQTLDDAALLLDQAERLGQRHVVIVGSGYIGLEMAEAFIHRGGSATVIDRGPHPLRGLDPDMGERVATALREQGVDYRPNSHVVGFEDGAVLTGEGVVPADLVVLGIGTAPNSALARDAGIRLGVRDAIEVDDRQATSVEGIWAAGDCATSTHRVTGEQVHIALGTYANKQARVAGINIGGGNARTAPVLGSAITKLCHLEIAMTGANSRQATAAGFDVVTQVIKSSTKAGYYPGASDMWVKFVVDRSTGRLLGAQIVGGDDSAKRIDTAATAITAGMTVEQIVALDLAYAPPFSPVWDPIAIAARESLKLV